jgi:hypothetical protein
MPRIKKAGPWNPQKAEAYVGKGVLKYGDTIPAIRGHITPVPNGPLVKKKGPFKGSTLKKGGTVKKIKKGFLGLIAAAPMAAAASMKAKSATKKLQKEAPKIMQAMGGMPPVGMKKGGTVVKVGGQTHKVFKNKKGDVVVDHTAGIPAGKWDKINLTKKSKAKTVKQGVASVRKWHKDNPDYYKKKKNGKNK